MRFALTPRFPSFWRDVDEVFRDFNPSQNATDNNPTFLPTTDVVETDKSFELHLDMPGFAPEQIDVKVEGNQLTVTAERKEEKLEEGKTWVRRERSHGQFVRSFALPDTVEGTTPQAAYKHGVLTVTLPKKPEVLPRSLKVKVEA
jgi:HSP20 family protein